MLEKIEKINLKFSDGAFQQLWSGKRKRNYDCDNVKIFHIIHGRVCKVKLIIQENEIREK